MQSFFKEERSIQSSALCRAGAGAGMGSPSPQEVPEGSQGQGGVLQGSWELTGITSLNP